MNFCLHLTCASASYSGCALLVLCIIGNNGGQCSSNRDLAEQLDISVTSCESAIIDSQPGGFHDCIWHSAPITPIAICFDRVREQQRLGAIWQKGIPTAGRSRGQGCHLGADAAAAGGKNA